MALAFIFALAQRLPLVGDMLDADTLHRMQQREVYLREQMTKLLLEIEERNRKHSRMGMQALLCTALTSRKILCVICLLVLLLWFTRRIYKKTRGAVASSDEESSISEEGQQKQVEVKDQKGDLFLADEELWPNQVHEDNCERILLMFRDTIQFCQNLISGTPCPVPGYPIRVGSAYEGWYPMENKTVLHLLVPLSAPDGYVFHVDLGTTGELPAKNSRVRVVLDCTCGREQEMGMLCFLHTSMEELRNQRPGLLYLLCTGSYLDAEKTVCWFQTLIKNAWKCMPQSKTCSMEAMLLTKRSCRFHMTDAYQTTFFTDVVLGVQQDNTDIFLSSQETEAGSTPSTTWPQSCAVAEVKFFQHIAPCVQEGSCYLRCIQRGARTLVGYMFSTYELKTVLMHLLNTIPSEKWDWMYFMQRIDDIVRYLHCCVEKKRLDHFLVGNEAVPEGIILPPEFRASQPFNLFQHLEQDPLRCEEVLKEIRVVQDGLEAW